MPEETSDLNADWIRELKRCAATPGPRYTGEQVHARLRALQEEWDRIGDFDASYMGDFLDKFARSDPGHMRQ